MKVIYLHQYFTLPSMNGGTRSYEMARRLVTAGHEVHVVTSDRQKKGAPYRTLEDGINVTWIPVPYSNHMGKWARIRAFVDFGWKSSRVAASLDGDVVFATSTPLTIAIPAVYAAKRKSLPMVLEIRDLWPEVPIGLGALNDPISKMGARWLERFAYRNANQIVALSPGMKDGVVATGYPAKQVTVIPNASDLKEFAVDPRLGYEFRAQREWLGERPLLVYAGTIGYANGIDYMVRLAQRIESIDPEIRFLVVGDGREQASVRALAESLGVLDKNFFMFPPVPRQDLPIMLSAADIASSFVINREVMWNNSANKFFNALAASKPIVINHEGWQAEMIRDHDIGLVLDPVNIDTSARCLATAIRQRDWLLRAGAAARQLGEQCFARDQLAFNLEQVLWNATDYAESYTELLNK